MSGLGGFLGGGADPVYDPVLVQGLQITEQAITHVANAAPPPNAAPAELGFSSPVNLELWADWVRASVYMADFLRGLDWAVDAGAKSVALRYAGQSFATIYRPGMATFMAQLEFLRQYLDQRPDRTPEASSQLSFPLPYFAMVLGLQTCNRWTFELISITQVLASHVVMVAKHHLACRRPTHIGATVMPFIPTPAHGSFPSGHATEAHAVTVVMNAFMEQQPGRFPDFQPRQILLRKLAERIAVNRTVAGVHFPIDTWAGAIIGRAVGQIVLAKCGIVNATVDGYSYSAQGDRDFYGNEFWKGTNPDFGVTSAGGSFPVNASPEFQWLWGKAVSDAHMPGA